MPRTFTTSANSLRCSVSQEFEAIPARTQAAIAELLPALKAQLMVLCDLNDIIARIKTATAAVKDGSGSQDVVAALWEEAKIRGKFVSVYVGLTTNSQPREWCCRALWRARLNTSGNQWIIGKFHLESRCPLLTLQL